MVFYFEENTIKFRSEFTSKCVEVILPTKAPVNSVCHRPEVNLIVISLFDFSDPQNNEYCNVYGVDDRTGKIIWKIKEGVQKDPINQYRHPYYIKIMEFSGDSNLYAFDNWYSKWKIDLETGDVEEVEKGNGGR